MILLCIRNCSSNDPEPEREPTAEEQQLDKLAKTWALGVVTHGGDDVTDHFEDFASTITKGKAYTASGSLSDFDYKPFKQSGTWDFADDNLNRITRNDGVEMDQQQHSLT